MTQERRWTPSGRKTVRAARATWLLLLATALQLMLAVPGQAQPAANARPTGGTVVAGSATIATSSSTTTINQSSQRAAINWQSFNVGSQQTVDFVQPSSSAVALNRVISASPSQIAGHIDANGQVILVNQSGVMFYQGALVNAAGLIVSAAGISTDNFMAGKLVFDQAANPNASVVNQGKLTVTEAGLAALVAPTVANSGTITAKLGHVALAGAKTATIDLFGDGLVSLDVSNEVTQAPVGAGGTTVTALVTNSGTIQANGGTVQLTAREADGLVQSLVQAAGKITANSVGSKTGTIELSGLGGSIVLSGTVTAAGKNAGTVGGQVEVDAGEGVTLSSTARVSASGAAGGGTVAIGTTLARANGGPGTVSTLTASAVDVEKGATIAANATANGNGGRVTVLSSLSTIMAGSIAADGGPKGGNGGFVEVSGGSLSLPGKVAVSAPLGTPCTIIEDPTDTKQ
jgi:filamentous hemagglutinin family protein